MKKFLGCVLSFLLLTPAALADTPLGAPITLSQSIPVSDILAHPDRFVGQKVRIRGLVVDVCAKRGCWMALASEKGFDQLRVKVRDGVIVFPMEARGREASVEGVVERFEVSPEQRLRRAKHLAEERGQKFNPDDLKQKRIVYQIRATGAVLH